MAGRAVFFNQDDSSLSFWHGELILVATVIGTAEMTQPKYIISFLCSVDKASLGLMRDSARRATFNGQISHQNCMSALIINYGFVYESFWYYLYLKCPFLGIVP